MPLYIPVSLSLFLSLLLLREQPQEVCMQRVHGRRDMQASIERAHLFPARALPVHALIRRLHTSTHFRSSHTTADFASPRIAVDRYSRAKYTSR